jgi:hypothetical protein
MPPFFFRCPISGSDVHGFVVHETPSPDLDSYEPVTCFACRQMHLVNFRTGKTVGERRKTGSGLNSDRSPSLFA